MRVGVVYPAQPSTLAVVELVCLPDQPTRQDTRVRCVPRRSRWISNREGRPRKFAVGPPRCTHSCTMHEQRGASRVFGGPSGIFLASGVAEPFETKLSRSSKVPTFLALSFQEEDTRLHLPLREPRREFNTSRDETLLSACCRGSQDREAFLLPRGPLFKYFRKKLVQKKKISDIRHPKQTLSWAL